MSVTYHDLALNRKTLHYTATAGMLLIRDEEYDIAHMGLPEELRGNVQFG